MSKEHKTLTEFFTFFINKKNHLELKQQDAEEVIQDYYKHRAELTKKAEEEKRRKNLKKLELIVQKREEQRLRTLKPKAQKTTEARTISEKITEAKTITKPIKKSIKEMQILIDRIRN